jgi:hypothetical protein
MSFNQFTKCVDAKDHSGQNEYVQASIAALISGFIATAITIAVSGGPSWCLLLVVPITGAIFVIAYCRWFLYDRLICLPDGGSDQLAMGVVVEIDNHPASLFPNPFQYFCDPGDFDNDYSFSILLAPNEPGCTLEDKIKVETSLPFGVLVSEQDATRNRGLPFSGKQGTNLETKECSWVLHCEIEGAGNRDLMLTAEIILGFAALALVACLFGAGLLGLILSLIVSVLAYVVGVIVAHNDGASPSDVNPTGEISVGDCLAIMGSWVYDSGHINDPKEKGWNELHPVKSFCKANCDSGDVILLRNRWQVAIDDATSPATLESQKLPQNQWKVHPLIDGCQPPIVV